jgi:hypothetical protein
VNVPMGRWLARATITALLLLTSCRDCKDEIDAAGTFLEQSENLACHTDEDCRLVYTSCHTFPGGHCGQSPLNVYAATSAEWKKLSDALTSCKSGCPVCAVLVLVHCGEGVCL